MRIAFDATPAAVQTAGVGRYARELLRALLELDFDDRYLLAVTGERQPARDMLDNLPPGAWRELRHLPVSNRVATLAWQLLCLPLSAERLLGPFDVYHGTDFVTPPTRAPRVVTVHDMSFRLHPEYAEPSLAAYLSRAVPRAVAAADAVIAVSASVAREIASIWPGARHKLVAIQNGVRCVTPARRAETHAPSILIVGTIEPRKGHDTLLDAARQVQARTPDLQLVIAGRVGWRAGPILAAIRRAEAEGFARFVEHPRDNELDQLYADASVVVVPSRYEGFGLPLIEALARGVPAVASDIAALREVGAAGALYAEVGRADAFAAAIDRVLHDSQLRLELVEAGFARARSLSWDVTAQRTRRVYAQVTGQ